MGIRHQQTTVYFNHDPVAYTNCHKRLEMYLDEKLNFLQHIKEKTSKANRGIYWSDMKTKTYTSKTLSYYYTYKLFVRTCIDYGDIIYDQPNNESFCNKIERVQYNAALAITGAIRGTSKTKLYHELGLESLKFRRWMRRLVCSIKSKHLSYLNICII